MLCTRYSSTEARRWACCLSGRLAAFFAEIKRKAWQAAGGGRQRKKKDKLNYFGDRGIAHGKQPELVSGF